MAYLITAARPTIPYSKMRCTRNSRLQFAHITMLWACRLDASSKYFGSRNPQTFLYRGTISCVHEIEHIRYGAAIRGHGI